MELKSIKEQLNVSCLRIVCETHKLFYYCFKDAIIKLKGGFALDINLEKNRTNEMVIFWF